MRTGAPVPPAIFMGNATRVAPDEGTSARPATF
jgi:hypothetical protein